MDNVFVERLWRTVKYEGFYLKDYGSVPDARGVGRNFHFYNYGRLHQTVAYQAPTAVHAEAKVA